MTNINAGCDCVAVDKDALEKIARYLFLTDQVGMAIM